MQNRSIRRRRPRDISPAVWAYWLLLFNFVARIAYERALGVWDRRLIDHVLRAIQNDPNACVWYECAVGTDPVTRPRLQHRLHCALAKIAKAASGGMTAFKDGGIEREGVDNAQHLSFTLLNPPPVRPTFPPSYVT